MHFRIHRVTHPIDAEAGSDPQASDCDQHAPSLTFAIGDDPLLPIDPIFNFISDEAARNRMIDLGPRDPTTLWAISLTSCCAGGQRPPLRNA